MTSRSSVFEPIMDIGSAGRRALAWYLDDGVVVLATDADVAGHALAVVLEALQMKGRWVHAKYKRWATEILREFSDFPDVDHSVVEHRRGEVDVNANDAAVGYGYVRPVSVGHECGGALFHRSTHTVTGFEPHAIFLTPAGYRQ